MGANLHGAIKLQPSQQMVAALVIYLITAASLAASITLIQPKPELMLLLLWYAGHPLYLDRRVV
jgi:hypothetical protein